MGTTRFVIVGRDDWCDAGMQGRDAQFVLTIDESLSVLLWDSRIKAYGIPVSMVVNYPGFSALVAASLPRGSDANRFMISGPDFFNLGHPGISNPLAAFSDALVQIQSLYGGVALMSVSLTPGGIAARINGLGATHTVSDLSAAWVWSDGNAYTIWNVLDGVPFAADMVQEALSASANLPTASTWIAIGPGGVAISPRICACPGGERVVAADAHIAQRIEDARNSSGISVPLTSEELALARVHLSLLMIDPDREESRRWLVEVAGIYGPAALFIT